MNQFFDRFSIRNKLVIINVLVVVPVLVIGFYFLITRDIKTFKEDLKTTAELIAIVIADNNSSALDFNDSKAAKESLSYVSRVEYVTNVILSDLSKVRLARFDHAEYSNYNDIVLLKDTTFFDDEYLYVYQKVVQVTENKVNGYIHLRATTKFLNEKIKSHVIDTLYLLTFLIILAFILSYRLQSIISSPILDLTNIAEHVTETGDYTIRPEKEGNDELTTLYNSFGLMLSQINERTEKLELMNKALGKEVGDRIKAEVEVREKAEELKKRNEELDKFAYVTSHDLKAPLRAISNLSTWIEEDLGDDLNEEISENFSLMRGRVKRMENLINGILRYSRADRLREESSSFSVTDLINDVTEDFKHDEKVIFKLNNIPDRITTERLKFFQVFHNLISNAVKYNDKEVCIVEIGGEAKGKKFEFYIKDNGPGIAKEYYEKVFMIFQTLEARDKIESTGIGLSIVKKIVEDFSGEIWITSKMKEETTFHFTWVEA